MASKKQDTNSVTVKVTVPARPGIAIRDIEGAAKRAGRDKVPAEINLNVCQYDLVNSTKQGDERTYDVKISWGPGIISPDVEPVDDHDDRVKAILTSGTESAL